MESTRVDAPIDEGVVALLAEGFDEAAIARLIVVRRHCYEGRYTELTPEARRLQFMKWLFQQGRVRS